MRVNHAIDLNLSAATVPAELNMAQNDTNSRTIVAALWDGTSGFTIPADASAMVRFYKPDGTGGLYDETEAGDAVTHSGNIVTAPVASQMLSVAGKVLAAIEIYQPGQSDTSAVKLGTFCFTVNVAKSVFPDATIISSDYYNILAADIAEALDAAQTATGSVKYNIAQTLTDQQKSQARENIGASAKLTFSVGENLIMNRAGTTGYTFDTKAALANPNLLYNWYFVNPVNQRGKTLYTGAAGYTVDGWRCTSSGCKASVVDGVLRLEESGSTTVYYRQKLETPITAPATLSVLTGSTTGAVTAYVLDADGESAGSVNLSSNTLNVLNINTGSIGVVGFGVPDGGKAEIVAVKLERGPYQTLAYQEAYSNSWTLYEIPDYSEQLAKCQRYFVRLGNNAEASQLLSGGMARTTTDIGVMFFLPVPMRALPAVSVSNAAHFSYSKGQPSAGVACSAVAGYYGMRPYNMRSVTFTGSGLTAGEYYNINVGNGGYIDFSAELT